MEEQFTNFAARAQDELEAKGADVEDVHFETLAEAEKRAKYLLTETFRLTSESADRLGFSQVLVNGKWVSACLITPEVRMTRIEWLTIATNRTRVKRGFDGGRSSWKLHAVRLEDDQQKFSDIPDGTETVCGIRHACGFDLNLFIRDRCKRCERILARVPVRAKL
jgi:hypothetical protein